MFSGEVEKYYNQAVSYQRVLALIGLEKYLPPRIITFSQTAVGTDIFLNQSESIMCGVKPTENINGIVKFSVPLRSNNDQIESVTKSNEPESLGFGMGHGGLMFVVNKISKHRESEEVLSQFVDQGLSYDRDYPGARYIPSIGLPRPTYLERRLHQIGREIDELMYLIFRGHEEGHWIWQSSVYDSTFLKSTHDFVTVKSWLQKLLKKNIETDSPYFMSELFAFLGELKLLNSIVGTKKIDEHVETERIHFSKYSSNHALAIQIAKSLLVEPGVSRTIDQLRELNLESMRVE